MNFLNYLEKGGQFGTQLKMQAVENLGDIFGNSGASGTVTAPSTPTTTRYTPWATASSLMQKNGQIDYSKFDDRSELRNLNWLIQAAGGPAMDPRTRRAVRKAAEALAWLNNTNNAPTDGVYANAKRAAKYQRLLDKYGRRASSFFAGVDKTRGSIYDASGNQLYEGTDDYNNLVKSNNLYFRSKQDYDAYNAKQTLLRALEQAAEKKKQDYYINLYLDDTKLTYGENQAFDGNWKNADAFQQTIADIYGALGLSAEGVTATDIATKGFGKNANGALLAIINAENVDPRIKARMHDYYMSKVLPLKDVPKFNYDNRNADLSAGFTEKYGDWNQATLSYNWKDNLNDYGLTYEEYLNALAAAQNNNYGAFGKSFKYSIGGNLNKNNMNKYQLGGAAPQGQDMQQQIVQLVQAAMSGDQLATETINLIMQAAQQGDQQAILIAQLIQQVAQQMQGGGLQGAPIAKKGAKLSYIHRLATGCPEGTEPHYYKKGGHICKACVEKANKAKKEQTGGRVNNNPQPNYLKYTNNSTTKSSLSTQKPTLDSTATKNLCGGKTKKHSIGGILTVEALQNAYRSINA